MNTIRAFSSGFPAVVIWCFVSLSLGILTGLALAGALKRAPNNFPTSTDRPRRKVHRQSHDERGAGFFQK